MLDSTRDDDVAVPGRIEHAVSSLFGGRELTAGAVDFTTASVANRRGNAFGFEPADEFAFVLGARGGPFRTRRRIERNQVHVHPAPVAVGAQHVAKKVGTPGLVVDVFDPVSYTHL